MARYGTGTKKDIERAIKKMEQGRLVSGKSTKKVTSKEQAIAIGLSEARKKGEKTPMQSK